MEYKRNIKERVHGLVVTIVVLLIILFVEGYEGLVSYFRTD